MKYLREILAQIHQKYTSFWLLETSVTGRVPSTTLWSARTKMKPRMPLRESHRISKRTPQFCLSLKIRLSLTVQDWTILIWLWRIGLQSTTTAWVGSRMHLDCHSSFCWSNVSPGPRPRLVSSSPHSCHAWQSSAQKTSRPFSTNVRLTTPLQKQSSSFRGQLRPWRTAPKSHFFLWLSNRSSLSVMLTWTMSTRRQLKNWLGHRWLSSCQRNWKKSHMAACLNRNKPPPAKLSTKQENTVTR